MPQPPPRSLPSPGAGRRCSRRVPQHSPHPRQGSLPWGRVCRGTVPCPGGRLTSPWRCRFNRCCCWSCCICRSCCWKASCLFPNGCRETKGRNQSTLFPASQQKPRKGGRGSAARDARGGEGCPWRRDRGRACLRPAAGPAQLAAEPDGGFDLSEEEGKKRKGEGKNKALKREGASRAGGLLRAETQLCRQRGQTCKPKPWGPTRGGSAAGRAPAGTKHRRRKGGSQHPKGILDAQHPPLSRETVPICQKMTITSPFLSTGEQVPSASTGAPTPAMSIPQVGDSPTHPQEPAAL